MSDDIERSEPAGEAEKACKLCKYYDGGKCRRRSPQFYTFTQYYPSYDRDTPGTEQIESSSDWPKVNEDDWCGEFSKRVH